jgi:hypothetical protein
MSALPQPASSASQPADRHRLEGFEPDNVLAFLALLGLLRAVEAEDRAAPVGQRLYPRASWDIDRPPLRPVIHLGRALGGESVADVAARGVARLTKVFDFGQREKLKLTPAEARGLFEQGSRQASAAERHVADLWAALAIEYPRSQEREAVERTPFCLLDVAQTSFLKNLSAVVEERLLSGKGRSGSGLSKRLASALFSTWQRGDTTPSFRLDPMEGSRHAYRWFAPTDDKQGVEHGANVLAAVGLTGLTVLARTTAGQTRAVVAGGRWQRAAGDDTGFSFAWPIWRARASRAAILSLLSHPALREPNGLAHLGVEDVLETRRIRMGKYMGFTRARTLEPVERSGN